MAPEQKRFRKRGGAKKNKNKKRHESLPSPPITATPTFHEATQTPLDQPLQTYLTKLTHDLTQLPPDPLEDENDPPPAVLLARNALHELTPRATEIARDATASHLLETLLRTAAHRPAAAALLAALTAPGSRRVAALVGHNAASHVVEAVLTALQAPDGPDADAENALDGLAGCCTEWTPQEIGDVMHSPSGSHAFRAIIAALAGLPVDEPREAKLDDGTRGRIRSYVERMGVPVGAACRDAVCAMGRALVDGVGEGLKEFAWRAAPCAALQALVAGVSRFDKELAREIVEVVLEGQAGGLMRDACGSRFVERAVVCVGPGVVEAVWKGGLVGLVKDGRANFCVQRILLGLRGRGAVMGAWDELEGVLEELLGFGKGRDGVVLSLVRVTEVEGDENGRRRASRCVARACGAVGGKASSFVGRLAFGGGEVWETWRGRVGELGRAGIGMRGGTGDVLKMPYGVPSPRLIGVLIARCIMRYPGGPGQSIRDSMATLSDVELLVLIGHPVGSRLVEQWMEGESLAVNGKIAGKVVGAITNGADNKLSILAVAKNPCGARVLIKCAGLVATKQRKIVMEALAAGFDQLKMSDCGQMVLRKCRVEQYMRRGEDWEYEESARETRERMFADILDEEDGEVVKKTRKRKRSKETIKQSDVDNHIAPSDSLVTSTLELSDVPKKLKGDDGDLQHVLGAIKSAAEGIPKEKHRSSKKKKKQSKSSS